MTDPRTEARIAEATERVIEARYRESQALVAWLDQITQRKAGNA